MIRKKKSKYYISLQEATRFCNYSQEYLSLRARRGKLKSKKVGRNWVTTEEWLKEYLANIGEYNGKDACQVSLSEPPENLPVGELTTSTPDIKSVSEIPPSLIGLRPSARRSRRASKKLKLIFAAAIVASFVAAGSFLGTQKYALNIFNDYADWMSEKTGFAIFKKEFLSFGGILKEKISNFGAKPYLTKEELIEVEDAQTKTIIDRFVEELKKLSGREIIKEVKKVTEVQPIKEITITKETVKIDDKELKKLKEQISYLEGEIAKRLYAPGGVITQQIYVKEPVQSPKIYQENGDIVLQTLGSGNVILSAATGLQLYGSQVVINSTSLLNPLIALMNSTRIDGNLTVTGNISGKKISGSDLTLSGNASIGGNLSVLGNVTVDGYLTSNATITAAAFVSASGDSSVRKSGEEVFREILPISRYDIPAQTGTTSYFRISKSFEQNPLTSVPAPLLGASRVYKLIIKYDDNIPANSSSSWRIYRPSAGTTTASFVLFGRNSTSTTEGIATTTENLAVPDTDWQVDVKLSEADAGKSLRIFQIFLAAFDRIN